MAVPPARHGKVELHGQIAPPGAPSHSGDYKVIESVAELVGVNYLPVVNLYQGVAYHILYQVQCALEGCLVPRVEAADDG